MKNNLQHRKRKSTLLFYFTLFLSLMTFLPLILLFFFILYKGMNHFSINVLIESFPYGSNKLENMSTGGFFPAIIGSFLIVFFSILIGAPIGIMTGISIGNKPKSKISRLTMIASDSIQGTPAIVIGLIAYYWFVLPFKQFSAISASLAFAILILPIIITSTAEKVQSIPNHIKEAAYSLGADETKTIRYILFPLSFPIILNSIILSIARILGESAPLLFTAFGFNLLTFDITNKMHSISLLIYQYANSPFKNQQQLAWNASLFLILIIFSLNFISKIIYNRLRVKNL